MKKILLLLVFAAMTIAIHTQGDTVGYKSIFGHESTVWHGATEYYHSWWENRKFQTNGDTIIGEHLYRKIECYDLYRNGDERRFSRGDFYLREDTATGRVWYRFTGSGSGYVHIDPEFIDTDLLVMDMSMEIGDSIMIFENFNGHFHPQKYYVESIFYADSMKIIQLYIYRDDDKFAKLTLLFIEGVGPSTFFGLYLNEQVENVLLCCHKDGELIFHVSERTRSTTIPELAEDQCTIPPLAVIEKIEDEEISVSPNPCGEWINIGGEKLQRAEIYDINGRYVQTIQDFNTTVNIGTLSPGCYILKIYANGITTNHKLVKLSN